MSMKITLTKLAEGFAAKVGGVNALKERAAAEVNHLLANGLASPEELILHVIEMGSDNTEFIIYGCDDGVEVDTCTYEEYGEPIKHGRFKGKTIMMPRRDSE